MYVIKFYQQRKVLFGASKYFLLLLVRITIFSKSTYLIYLSASRKRNKMKVVLSLL